MIEMKPCPFCGSEIKHVESWAKSFNPPRLYREWHHVLNNPEECVIRRAGAIVANATDDAESQQVVIKRWNTRPPSLVDREAVARIIEPDAFRSWQSLYDHNSVSEGADFAKRCADYFHGEKVNEALTKADAILSLVNPVSHP
jgi:hypothetical protein